MVPFTNRQSEIKYLPRNYICWFHDVTLVAWLRSKGKLKQSQETAWVRVWMATIKCSLSNGGLGGLSRWLAEVWGIFEPTNISLLFKVVNDCHIRETAKKRYASGHGTRMSYPGAVSCHDIEYIKTPQQSADIIKWLRCKQVYWHPGSTPQMRTTATAGYSPTQSFPIESEPNWVYYRKSYFSRCSSTMSLSTGIRGSVPLHLVSPCSTAGIVAVRIHMIIVKTRTLCKCSRSCQSSRRGSSRSTMESVCRFSVSQKRRIICRRDVSVRGNITSYSECYWYQPWWDDQAS